MDRKYKIFILFVVVTLFFSVIIYMNNTVFDYFDMGHDNICGNSVYNPTNDTYAGNYMNGKCYYSTYNSYESTEICKGGLFGLFKSCYESKPYIKYTRGRSVCVDLETGEAC